MCGIIGIIGKTNVVTPITDCLKKLEYRGYDSAGIALLEAGEIRIVKCTGKVANLQAKLASSNLSGTTGIGHTRWATHGAINEINAHPHCSIDVAVVHNGIIENAHILKSWLEASGVVFNGETDTEIIHHLISFYLKTGMSYKEAVIASCKKLEGSFAIAAIFKGNDKLMIVAKKGSPLAIGYGDGEIYVGSDSYALSNLSNQLCYLHDGDIAVLTNSAVEIFNQAGDAVIREIKTCDTIATSDKGEFEHFMLKEIHDQPEVLTSVINNYSDIISGRILMPNFTFQLANIKQIKIIACGTSYYAAIAAKYLIEKYGFVSVEVLIASEYRYNPAPFQLVDRDSTLAIFISQSGETADTLAALKYAKTCGMHTMALVNVVESSIALHADNILAIGAGTEIGVASTKAFTAQLMVFAIFALELALQQNLITAGDVAKKIQEFRLISGGLHELLSRCDEIKRVAAKIARTNHVLYVGRGLCYPIAMEGALKLKELSYIPSEGIAAGELKHGPIALIEVGTPVIALAPSDELFEKTASNIEEIAVRGANIFMIGDQLGTDRLRNIVGSSFVLKNNNTNELTTSIQISVTLQLLAYFTALYRGNDVDQPRNLAKSVTVE